MVRPTHDKYKAIYCIRWSLGGSTRVLYQTSVRIVGSFHVVDCSYRSVGSNASTQIPISARSKMLNDRARA